METRYKMMMISGAQMVSMLYLIQQEIPASAAVMMIALTALFCQKSENCFNRSSVGMILSSMMIGEGFLMLQPMRDQLIWHLAVLMNGIFACKAYGYLNTMNTKDRAYLRWVMDWLLAFSFLLAGVLFLMPQSVRMYVMAPLYMNEVHNSVVILVPMILCLPYYPLRILMKQIRTVKCSVYEGSHCLKDPEFMKNCKLTKGNFVK